MIAISFEQLLLLAVLFMLPVLGLLRRWLGIQAARNLPRNVEAEEPKPTLRARDRRSPALPSPRERVIPPGLTVAQPGIPAATGFRLGTLREIRRGIVLMTVLGRCRALEPPP